MFKKSICCIVTGLMVFGFLNMVLSSEKMDTHAVHPVTYPMAYTLHAPIRINSDAEFNASFSNRTIWNLEINGTGNGFCIFIGNCSQPFTVKDCYLHNAYGREIQCFWNTGLYLNQSSNGTLNNNSCNGNYYGIYLENSNNNTLTNNNCSDNIVYDGIFLSCSNNNTLTGNNCNANSDDGIFLYWQSHNNTFIGNNCNGNSNCGIFLSYSNTNTFTNNTCNMDSYYGIYMQYSNANTLNNNTCNWNSYCGIYMEFSNTNTLKQNKMYGCGILIYGYVEFDYNFNLIDITNLVNNKPVYYLKNQTGGIIPPGAGQVMLVNCSHITVDKQTMVNCTESILVVSSNNCTFSNNTCSGNSYYDILLMDSNTNTLTNNTCKWDLNDGILVSFSNSNTLTGNNCSDISGNGIYIENSINNTVNNNNCSGNYEGICVGNYASSNTFTENTLQGNTYYGIYIDCDSNKNRIHSNYIINNSDGGKQAYDKSGKNFWNTSIEGNWWSDWTGPDNNWDGIVDNPYTIDGGVGAIDYYPLTIPGTNGTNCTYYPPLVIVTDPSLGSVWYIGNEYYINWTITNGTAPYTIWINYSTDGGFTYNTIGGSQPIVQSFNGTGAVKWTIPSIAPSINCRIKVDAIGKGWGSNISNIYTIDYGNKSLANTSWPMFRHDLTHTGRSEFSTENNTGKIRWKYAAYRGFRSSPAIGSNETIYVGGYYNSLYSINPDGTEKWRAPTMGGASSSPAIDSNGIIYIGSEDHHLYAVFPNGTVKWSFLAGDTVRSSPAIGMDGTIYVGSFDDKLHAIYPNGTMKWTYTTGNWIDSSPAIGTDGIIYIGSWDSYIHAIYPNGTKKWSFYTGNPVNSPAIGIDGTIYVGSQNGNLYALYPNGTKKWSFTMGGSIYSTPAISSDGTICIGSLDKNLYAIYPNGTKKWSYNTNDQIYSSPVIDSKGMIYLGSYNELHCIFPNGTAKWKLHTESIMSDSSAIGKDGTLYICTYNGDTLDYYLYAIGSPTIPSTPRTLSALRGNRTVTLNWSEPLTIGGSPIISYKIYQGTSSGIYSTSTIIGNITQYTITNLMNNVKYYFAVSAINSFGEGPKSNEINAMLATPPQAPTNLIAYSGDQHIILYWDDSILNPIIEVTGFKIYWGTVSGTYTNNITIYNLTTKCTIDNFTNGITYFIKVSALNSTVEGLESSEVTATPQLSAWPVYNNNLNHTGRSEYNTSTIMGKKKWAFNAGNCIKCSPVIGPDGTIYFGCDDWLIYAVYPNGSLRWSYTASYKIHGSPAVSDDCMVYIGTCNGNFFAIYPNGNLKWQFTTGAEISSSPVIGSDDTIYFGCDDGNLYALYPNMTCKWVFTTGGVIRSSPAIGLDGTIYIGSCDGKLYAIYPNGTKKWEFAGGAITTSQAIGLDGTIYMTSWDSNVYAIYPNGTKKWTFKTGDLVLSSPSIGPDGTIYASSQDGFLYAIYPNGTKKWDYPIGPVAPTVSIGAEGTIYMGLQSGAFCALYPNGTLKWFFSAWAIYCSPAIGSDNTVYFGSDDSKLYAIGGTPSCPRNLSAIPANAAIKLSWKPPIDDWGYKITNYTIYYGTTHGIYTNKKIINNNQTCNITGLTNGINYYFSISATNSIGEGVKSSEIVSKPATTPTPPTIILVTPGNKKITIEWNTSKNDGGFPIISYKLYWGVSSHNYVKNDTVSNATTVYTILSLTNGLVYYCSVCAINAIGEGILSTESCVQIPYHFDITSIKVTPDLCNITVDESIQFHAIGYDVYGNPFGISPTWEATNGTINDTGYYCPWTVGIQKIYANLSGYSGVSNVTVTNGSLYCIMVTPPTATITADENLVLTCHGYDKRGNLVNFVPIWSATNGTIDNVGLFHPYCVGTWLIYANYSGLSGNAGVTVTHGCVKNIIVTPSAANLECNQTQSFSAQGYDHNNNIVSGMIFDWTTNAGSINANGLFRASNSPKTGYVTAANSSIKGTANINVEYGILTKIIITQSTTVITVDQTLKFSAFGYNKYNILIPISPIWSATNGSIDSDGTFHPYSIGDWEIYANQSSVSGVALIKVTLGKLRGIHITPSNMVITADNFLKFTAIGYDLGHNIVPIAPTWSVNAGIIDIDGLYHPTKVGTWVIYANYSGICSQTSVIVTPGQLASITVFPSLTIIFTNETKTYSAIGYDVHGNIVSIQPKWTIDNHFCTFNGNTLLVSAIAPPGVCTIYVNQSGISGVAHAIIVKNPGEEVDMNVLPNGWIRIEIHHLKYIIIIETSSDVLSVSFNKTNLKIQISISGKDGTIGITNITIPKPIILSTSDITILLDNQILNFTVKQDLDNYFISLLYYHSSHELSIRLQKEGTTITPPNQTSDMLVTIGILGTISIAILALFSLIFISRLKRKLKRKVQQKRMKSKRLKHKIKHRSIKKK